MSCIDCGTHQHVIPYNEQIPLCLDCINKRESEPVRRVEPEKQPTRKPLTALHIHSLRNQKVKQQQQDMIDQQTDWAILVDQNTINPRYTSSHKVLREVDEINAMRSRMFQPRPRMFGMKNKGYGLDDLVRELNQYNQQVFGPVKKKKRGLFRR